jgi:hypothetical protein
MPDFLTKLKRGHTKMQIKSRDKRFKKRKAQIETLLGGASVQLEYDSLDALLDALNGDGAPFLTKKTLIRDYILDWRRKEKHEGTQTWYALCDMGHVVQHVVWTLTGTGKNGELVNGGKIYDMTKTAMEELELSLNLV